MAGFLTFFNVGGWLDDFCVALRDNVAAFDRSCVVADGDMSDVTSRRVLFLGGAEQDFSELDDLSGLSATETWQVGWSLFVQWDTRSFSDARRHAQGIVERMWATVASSPHDQVLEATPTLERYMPAMPEDGVGAEVLLFGTIRLTVVTA